jgi:hypothetical protein
MAGPEAQYRLVEWLCRLQKPLLDTKNTLSIVDLSASLGVALEVSTLGTGSHGSVVLYTDTQGVFSRRTPPLPVSIALKVQEGEQGVENVGDYEIYVASLLSKMCRGSSLNVYQLSPHVVRVFGGMDAVWELPGHAKIVKRAMAMEPLRSPISSSTLKELLYEMRNSSEAWANGWMRLILFQVIYTLAVWGPRFRHNDLTPLNVVLNALPEERQKAGYAYALRLDKDSILYFHTAKERVMPFELKIIDFGYALDVASPEGWSLPKLSKESQRALGMDTSPSAYFDLYSFLHTTYALSGFLETLDSVDDEGRRVEQDIFPVSAPTPLNPDSHPEVKAFVEFMARYGVAKMPRVSQDQVERATGSRRLIRQWIPLAIQAKAEASDGKIEDDYGSPFTFFTPAQILQDPYFGPLRVDLEGFASMDLEGRFYAGLGAAWNPSLPTSVTPLIMACETPSTSSGRSEKCTALDGRVFDPSLSLPLEATIV